MRARKSGSGAELVGDWCLRRAGEAADYILPTGKEFRLIEQI